MLDSGYHSSAVDPVYSDDDFVADPKVQWSRAWNKIKRVKSREVVPGIRTRSVTREKQFIKLLPEASLTNAFARAGASSPLPKATRFRRGVFQRKALRVEVEHRPNVVKTEKFLPSKELTAFWTRGLRDHIQEMQTPSRLKDGYEFAVRHSSQTTDILATRLKRIIALVANRQNSGIERTADLAKAGRFSLAFQHQILNRITVRPDESSEFFSMLFKELHAFLHMGGSLEGAWGRLRIKEETIFISPKGSVEVAVPGNWSRAEVIE
jgi:hypothetical protein